MRKELARVLSKAGLCSRKIAADWIREGRVRVDGKVLRDPSVRVQPSRDAITLDGKRVREARHGYWALHKPRGYLTTRRDPSGRATVYDLIGDLGEWVVPIGRLDRDSSGLLLFTNNTQFAERVTNPISHVPKIYRVTARPRLSDEALERLREGVLLRDGRTRPAIVKRLGDRGPCSVLEITITEGKNRQVRRMVKEIGGSVQKLARISIGEVRLGDLAPGALRPLTTAEIRGLSRV